MLPTVWGEMEVAECSDLIHWRETAPFLMGQDQVSITNLMF